MDCLTKMNATEIQKHCESLGVPAPAVYDGDGGYSCRPAGLCPRCKQPISFHLTNGGKLSPSRTLRLQHVFSGDVNCEDEATNARLAAMSADEKVEFFVQRRDARCFAPISHLPSPSF